MSSRHQIYVRPEDEHTWWLLAQHARKVRQPLSRLVTEAVWYWLKHAGVDTATVPNRNP